MLTRRIVSRGGVCRRKCGAILSTPSRGGALRCFAANPEPKRPDPYEDPTARAAKSLPEGRLKDLLTNVSSFNKERTERIDSQRPSAGIHARVCRAISYHCYPLGTFCESASVRDYIVCAWCVHVCLSV